MGSETELVFVEGTQTITLWQFRKQSRTIERRCKLKQTGVQGDAVRMGFSIASGFVQFRCRFNRFSRGFTSFYEHSINKVSSLTASSWYT
jgi:hypothetical protein